MNNQCDAPSIDELEACSQYYQDILNETLPQYQATIIARDKYGIELNNNLLNSIMLQYAWTPLQLDEWVKNSLHKAGFLSSK